MVSNLRRKVRRYLLGATQKATGIWWIGRVTVRVMNGFDCKIVRSVRVKADHGAEKSRRTRRRKRSLRRRESRSCKGSSAPPAANSKTRSSRVVNHSGRKFIWAVMASNKFRGTCERFAKIPRGPIDPNRKLYRIRLDMKWALWAKWHRLHQRAEAVGIPPSAAFHRSFKEYLDIETDWDTEDAKMLFLDHLEALKELRDEAVQGPSLPVIVHPGPKRRKGDNPIRGLRKFCRACGAMYFTSHVCEKKSLSDILKGGKRHKPSGIERPYSARK